MDVLKKAKKIVDSKKGMMNKNLSDPSVLISILVGVLILAKIAVLVFPMIIDAFTNVSEISGFLFGSLFASNGLAQLILSVGLLVGVLAILGFAIFKKKR